MITLKRVAWAGLGTLLVLGLVLSVLLVWLLNSDSGLRFAANRGIAFAPGELTLGQIQGRALQRIDVEQLRWQQDGLQVEAESVNLRYRARGLLGNELHVDSLLISGLRIDLPPAQEAPADSDPLSELPALDLPLAIDVDRLSVRGLEIHRDGELLLAMDAIELSASLIDGRIALRELGLNAPQGSLTASGDIDTQQQWLTHLNLELEARAAEQHLQLLLELQGDLARMQAQLSLQQPAVAELKLVMFDVLGTPTWTLAAQVPQLNLSGLDESLPDLPLDFAFEASGDLASVAAAGQAQVDGRDYSLQDLKLSVDGQRVELMTLDLRDQETGGQLLLDGHVDAGGEALAFALRANFERLTVPDGLQLAGSMASGELDVDGDLDNYRFRLQADVQVEGETLTLQTRGSGTPNDALLDQLEIRAAGGHAGVVGRVQWQPQLAWDLALRGNGFDPGLLLPEFPGYLDMDLDSQGYMDEQGIHASLDVRSLQGELREREFNVSGALASSPERPLDGELSLRSGASRLNVRGNWAEQSEALIDVDVVALADLLPDGEGELSGQLRLAGPQGGLRLRGRLQSTELRALPLQIAGLALDVDLAIDHDAPGSARFEIDTLRWGEDKVQRVVFTIDGSLQQHTLAVRLSSVLATLSLAAEGGVDAQRWQGTLQDLSLSTEMAGDWELARPLALLLGAGEVRSERLCLVSGVSRLCAEARIDEQQSLIDGRIEAMPLALLRALVPRDDALVWSLEGDLNADFRARREEGQDWQGEARVELPHALALLGEGESQQQLVVSGLLASTRFDSEQLNLDLSATLQRNDRLSLTLTLQQPFGEAERQAIDARLQLAMTDIAWLDALGEQFENPMARLDADLRLAGTLADPQPGGQVALRELGVDIPLHGLELRDGELTLSVLDLRRLALDARLRSGPGALQLQGEVGLDEAGAATASVRVSGENFTAVDTRMVSASISPDLRLDLTGDLLRIRGTVDLPRALVDLSRLEGSVRPSSDVVILQPDGEDPERSALQVDSDITVRMGNEVLLKGFGFDGRVGGTLRVRDRPEQVTTGSGTLNVTGSYRAYGQNLTIERGRLLFSASPLENPGLDVRATRQVDEVTAGILVRGNARQPVLEVFSEPALDQGDALSYVVLGRPMSQVGSGEGAGLSAAAQALGVGGGNLLAQRIGSRMGLDEVGLEESAALGGTAFTVGKYLSPKLYIGYGVNIFDGGELVRLRYTLSTRWSVEAEVGTETRGILNWRLER